MKNAILSFVPYAPWIREFTSKMSRRQSLFFWVMHILMSFSWVLIAIAVISAVVYGI